MRASDLEHVPFYSTTFEVAAADGADALWGLIQCVRGWICRKWPEVPRDIERWSRFKVGTRAELDVSGVAFESALVQREDGSVSWAGTIRETFREGECAPREWRTSVGFAAREGLASGTVSVAVSYADYSGFLGPILDEPQASVPGLVRGIVECDWLEATTSGLPASLHAIGLGAGDFDAFWRFASKPGRTTPAVLVSPKFDGTVVRHALDVRALAAMLGTSARVYYSIDQDFCAEMDAGLPNLDLRCDGGTVRVYAPLPRFERPEDARRHRFFSFARAQELGEEQLLAILHRALAQQPVRTGQPLGIAEIRSELRVTRVIREARRIETLSKADAQRQIDEALDLSLQLEEENRQLTAQLSSSWTLGTNGGAGAGETVELPSWPKTPEAVGQLMVDAYPERLDFTERGWKSLRKECKASTELVWNALRDLACVAHGLYVSGARDIEGEFHARSTFEFASNAGMMTRKDPGLMAQYRDVYQGRELNCEAHVGKGNGHSKDRGDIRVYFAFDRTSGKIVVSSCGPHLDNYSTRKIH